MLNRTSCLWIIPGIMTLIAVIPAYGQTATNVTRSAFKRGEPVVVQRPGVAGAGVLTVNVNGKAGPVRIGDMKEDEKSLKFSSWDLAPGRYTIQMSDAQGKTVSSGDLTLVEGRAPSVKLAVFGDIAGNEIESCYGYLSAIGTDLNFQHIGPIPTREAVLAKQETAYQYGIVWVPILNTYTACLAGDEKEGIKPWSVSDKANREERATIALETGHGEYCQVFHTGKLALSTWCGGYPYACPNAPFAQRKMAEYVQTVAEIGKAHPGFEFLALDDEYGMLSNFGYGGDVGTGFTGYCKWCKKIFTEKTGLKEMPIPIYQAPGYVEPQDAPFAHWRRIIGVGTFGGGSGGGDALWGHNVRMKQAANKSNPTLQIMQCPGAMDGELDKLLFEVYLPFYVCEPVAVAMMEVDMNMAFGRESGKPLWPLIGWYDQKEYPANIRKFLTLEAKMLYSKGIECLGLAPYQGPVLNGEIRDAFAEIGAIKKTYGPFLLNLKPVKMPVAVLWSNTTQDYQKILKWDAAEEAYRHFKKIMETPWKECEVFESCYPALYYAHLPVEIITEKEVLSGGLDGYEALILCNHEYAMEAVMKKLEEYQGKVFADESTVLKPKKAVGIPADFTKWHYMIEAGKRPLDDYDKRESVMELSETTSRELVKPLEKIVYPAVSHPVEIDNNNLIYTLARNGESRYLFVYNTNLKQAEKGQVKINMPFAVLYNVMDRKPVELAEKAAVAVTVERGDWQVYLLSPGRIGPMELNVKKTEENGLTAVECQVRMLDEKKVLLKGAHPCQAVIVDPEGGESPYSTYLATDAGLGTYKFILARHDKKGTWTVVLTELITNRRALKSFEY